MSTVTGWVVCTVGTVTGWVVCTVSTVTGRMVCTVSTVTGRVLCQLTVAVLQLWSVPQGFLCCTPPWDSLDHRECALQEELGTPAISLPASWLSAVSGAACLYHSLSYCRMFCSDTGPQRLQLNLGAKTLSSRIESRDFCRSHRSLI